MEEWKKIVQQVKDAGGELPFEELNEEFGLEAILQALGLGYIRFTQDMGVVLREEDDPWDEVAEK